MKAQQPHKKDPDRTSGLLSRISNIIQHIMQSRIPSYDARIDVSEDAVVDLYTIHRQLIITCVLCIHVSDTIFSQADLSL